jgi:carbonic anhydrase
MKLFACLALLAAACTPAPTNAPANGAPAAEHAVPASLPPPAKAAPAAEDTAPAPQTPLAPAVTASPADRHTATRILGRVFRDNAAFIRNHRPEYFLRFAKKQHPRATVVACSDSRFHEHALDRMPDDDLFVIRNIGNQIDNLPGSVKYGIRHLHTPLLLIVGHVRCGAIKAAMMDYGGEHASIRRELDGLHLSIYRTPAAGTPEQKWLAYVVGNVHQQVRDAVQEYGPEVRAGKLTVVGAVYDFTNELRQGYGAIVVVNVNGEMDPARLRANPILAEARRIAGRRL